MGANVPGVDPAGGTATTRDDVVVVVADDGKGAAALPLRFAVAAWSGALCDDDSVVGGSRADAFAAISALTPADAADAASHVLLSVEGFSCSRVCVKDREREKRNRQKERT